LILALSLKKIYERELMKLDKHKSAGFAKMPPRLLNIMSNNTKYNCMDLIEGLRLSAH
jgi:hypothetical protein